MRYGFGTTMRTRRLRARASCVVYSAVRVGACSRRCSSAAEQGSHKPRVGGSIPPTATTLTPTILSLVPADILGHLLRDAGADEAVYGGATKIMDEGSCG